jgi:sulfide:quinone oxidoreductase
MKNLIILGGGTGGTIVANRVAQLLDREWRVIVVDPAERHLYQPGLLFLPFGTRNEDMLLRPRATTFDTAVEWCRAEVEAVDPRAREVRLVGGERLAWDLLVVATGAELRPELTDGLTGSGWRRDIFDFYTLEGAVALREALAHFERGRLVVNVVEMPIKCPVAPLEFLFLADDFFRRRGVREAVELVYATPLDGAFTRPIASRVLGHLLEDKGIHLETEFAAARVDPERRVIASYDEREVAYDLLVTVPTHGGARFLGRAGLGNELDFVPTHKHTLAVKGFEGIFALGDATDLLASKAGSVAHFQAEGLAENLVRLTRGRSLVGEFDGHANCFVETGAGKAMLIDFNYETEPLPGHYPVPGVGPFTLLGESRLNHWGKLAFRWMYWHGLLPGKPIPVPTRMSMAGKRRSLIEAQP